jgi:predicted anti-sigma-YlaC factor YlaD
MATHDIACRTVAFFVLSSAVNFVAVAVVGTVMWLGLGPDVSVALTLLPAALAVAAMAAVGVIQSAAARRGWTNLGDPLLHPQVTP